MGTGTESESVELRIEKIVYEGHALARLDGWVWFVDGGALPGELVEARIVRRAARHIWAEMVRILEPSPDRQTPPCPVAGVCGGCHLLHWAYPAQTKGKQMFVCEALRRVTPAETVLSTLSAADPLYFRNKMSFTIGRRKGAPVCGLHERVHADRICSASECVIQSAESQTIVRRVEQLLARPEFRGVGSAPERVIIREGRRTGERMILLDRFHGHPDPAPWIDAFGNLATTVVATGEEGDAPRVWTGDGRLRETLAGLTFDIGPKDFFQTNSAQAERTFQMIAGWVGEIRPARTLDLFAGTGAITAFLSRVSGDVIGVESHGPSIEAACRNAASNRLSNIRMVRGDAARVARGLVSAGPIDVVVADPPRAGLSVEARAAIVRLAAPHLILVSCNPATLGRDLNDLMAAGYEIETIQPIDMFPQSFHIEIAVRMVRATC